MLQEYIALEKIKKDSRGNVHFYLCHHTFYRFIKIFFLHFLYASTLLYFYIQSDQLLITVIFNFLRYFPPEILLRGFLIKKEVLPPVVSSVIADSAFQFNHVIAYYIYEARKHEWYFTLYTWRECRIDVYVTQLKSRYFRIRRKKRDPSCLRLLFHPLVAVIVIEHVPDLRERGGLLISGSYFDSSYLAIAIAVCTVQKKERMLRET